jgi:hypothetical protein
MMRARRGSGRVRRIAAAGVGLAVLALGGCASNDDAGARPAEPASTGGSSGSTAHPAAPATGKLLRIRAVSVNVPEGWTPTSGAFGDLGKGAGDPRSGGGFTLASVASLNAGASLAEQADAVARLGGYDSTKVRAPVVVNGVRCFHVTGTRDGEVADVFGAVHGDDQVSFSFYFDKGTTDAARRAVIGPVLASVRWG